MHRGIMALAPRNMTFLFIVKYLLVQAINHYCVGYKKGWSYLLTIIRMISLSVCAIGLITRRHRLLIDCSTSAQTMPSLALAQRFCIAINTDLKALETTGDTFIAQLLEAPSQIMPVTSLIILMMAVLMVSILRVNSHAIPAAAPHGGGGGRTVRTGGYSANGWKWPSDVKSASARAASLHRHSDARRRLPPAWSPRSWLPEPKFDIATTGAPPIRASEAATVLIMTSLIKSLLNKPFLTASENVPLIFSPYFRFFLRSQCAIEAGGFQNKRNILNRGGDNKVIRFLERESWQFGLRCGAIFPGV